MKAEISIREKQSEVFQSIADILGGLSSPVRIRLIHYLSQAPLTVEVLSKKINQSVANTSMHLRKMFAEKLVSVEVVGQRRLYSLHPAVNIFWEQVQDFSQALDKSLKLELDDLNWDQSLDETLDLLSSGKAVILDVRPADEVIDDLNMDQIIHIPYSEVEKKINLIPKRKFILVICRGRFCVLSANAVKELRTLGIKAYRLENSLFEIKSKLEERG